MAASKARLTKYIGADGSAVYAAKITEIVPFEAVPGALTLQFGDLDKRANLVPEWIAQHKPKVGGYFLVFDRADGQTLCRFESDVAMERDYVRAA